MDLAYFNARRTLTSSPRICIYQHNPSEFRKKLFQLIAVTTIPDPVADVALVSKSIISLIWMLYGAAESISAARLFTPLRRILSPIFSTTSFLLVLPQKPIAGPVPGSMRNDLHLSYGRSGLPARPYLPSNELVELRCSDTHQPPNRKALLDPTKLPT